MATPEHKVPGDMATEPQFISEAEMELALEHKAAKNTDEEAAEDERVQDEIYDMVDAVVPRTDDPTLPALTFRVWVIGMIWQGFINYVSVLSSFRTTPFGVSPFIAVIFAQPMAWVLQLLPRGVLNPGPFSIKEHALVYIFANSATSSSYALYNIIGQKYLLNQTIPTWGALCFLMTIQCFGFGLAGICRRYLVRPAAIIWPGNFSSIAVLHAFHQPSVDDSGYKTSRLIFFLLVVLAGTVYEFIPGYLAPIVGSVSLLCYISPKTNSPSAVKIFGSGANGLGMLGFSFDWAQININNPITSPLWAIINMYGGVWIFFWIITPILWATNAFGNDQEIGANVSDGPNGTGTWPLGYAMNTAAIFSKDGIVLSKKAFVNITTLSLNIAYYEDHKPIKITTFFAMGYVQDFLVLTSVLVHVGLWYGKDIWHRFRTALKDLDTKDVHAQLMDVYPEVPDWWYLATLLVFFGTGVAACTPAGGFNLDWWGVILALMLAGVAILPIGIVQGISGQQIGLNVISEFLIGLILPGKIVAVMAFKSMCYIAMVQGLSLVQDLKLGHYMKIPPRHMFIAQLWSTIFGGIIQLFVSFAIVEGLGRDPKKLIDPTNPSLGYKWKLQTTPPAGYAANGYNVFFSAGAIWGAIGPARFFGPDSPYHSTLWAFAAGAVLPIIPWYLHKQFPNSYWHLVNIPVIAVTATQAGQNQDTLITPVLVGLLVNYFIKKYRHAWWKKYAYTMSGALDTSAALGSAIIFLIFDTTPDSNGIFNTFQNYALNPYDVDGCAPDYFLTCNAHANNFQYKASTLYNFSTDAYCSGINFGGEAA